MNLGFAIICFSYFLFMLLLDGCTLLILFIYGLLISIYVFMGSRVHNQVTIGGWGVEVHWLLLLEF